MKKSVWIIVAVVVTIFTMGTALAMQQHAQQSTAPQTSSSSSQSSSASSRAASSSSQAKKVAAKKDAHKKSSSSKHKASSKTRAKTTKKSTKAASTSSVKAKKASSTARSTKKSSATKQAAKRTQAAATSTEQKSTSKSQSTGKVHLTVTGYKKTFFNDSVAISKNATAFSVLKASKLKLVYQSGVAVYVSSINGLAENDVKAGSGWKYKVNGKFIDKAANVKHVTNGDDVHWYFTTAGY